MELAPAPFKVTESVDEAVSEIVNFYRVYHSMRYVKGELVLRLQKKLNDGLVDRLRTEFADIVEHGSIEPTEALPAELNDAALLHMPRLRFWFDRRSLGRLRMLVDVINREG